MSVREKTGGTDQDREDAVMEDGPRAKERDSL